MRDEILVRKVRQRLHKAQAEFEDVEKQYSQLSKEIDTWQNALAFAEIEGEESEPDTTGPRSHTRIVTDAMAEILRDGRPMHRKKILERVQALGIHVSPTNTIGNLSARLSQDPRFRSDGRGNWRLADPSRQDNPEQSDSDAG